MIWREAGHILKSNGIKLKKLTKTQKAKFMYPFDYSVRYLGIEVGVASPADAIDTAFGIVKEALQKRRKRKSR